MNRSITTSKRLHCSPGKAGLLFQHNCAFSAKVERLGLRVCIRYRIAQDDTGNITVDGNKVTRDKIFGVAKRQLSTRECCAAASLVVPSLTCTAGENNERPWLTTKELTI